jgi:hypothetical protein
MASRVLSLLIIPLLAATAIACGSGEADPAPPSPAPVASPSPHGPEPTPSPEQSRARQIIEAATRNDTDELRELLAFTPTACDTNVQGAGGPPDCRPGEPEGTLVPVLAIVDCEGHFVREDEVALDPLETGAITFLDAYNAPSGFFPAGETVLLFTRQQSGLGEIGLQLVLTDESITGIRYGCGITAKEMLQLHGLGEPIDIDTPNG